MSMSDASMITRAPTQEASFGDYFALLKPRVMSLVVFTAMVGLLPRQFQCIRWSRFRRFCLLLSVAVHPGR